MKTAPDLTVGYVMGVGDQVPPAIEQLGRSSMITPDVRVGQPSRGYDVIASPEYTPTSGGTISREQRALLDYVKNGGTMIVQYRQFEFNDAQYGPYPAKVSSNRVTERKCADKNAGAGKQNFYPAEPDHIVGVGRMGAGARALLPRREDRATTILIQLEDQFPYNKGMKTGALVETTYGKGRWVYVGLNLWRQLPSGTTGAYGTFSRTFSACQKPPRKA